MKCKTEVLDKYRAIYHLSTGEKVKDYRSSRSANRGPNRFLFPHTEIHGTWCVQLTSGKIVLIDEEDVVICLRSNWSQDSSGYATCRRKKSDSRFHGVWMHREIMSNPPNGIVDHIDGDIFNNRKYNLRIVSAKESSYNKCKFTKSQNPYKGVVPRHDNPSLWRASITKDGIRIGLGSFSTPQAAAVAYNEKAREIYGDFARLNTII